MICNDNIPYGMINVVLLFPNKHLLADFITDNNMLLKYITVNNDELKAEMPRPLVKLAVKKYKAHIEVVNGSLVYCPYELIDKAVFIGRQN